MTKSDLILRSIRMTHKHQLRFQSHTFYNSKLVELEKNIVQTKPYFLPCMKTVKVGFCFSRIACDCFKDKVPCVLLRRVIEFFL